MATPPDPAAAWSAAASVAALFAVDPHGTGVAVRSGAGAARDAWLALAAAGCPATRPWRRVPLHVADHRLLGGLDLTATLRAGRPVAERGLLVEADGGVIVLAMAERLEAATAARLAAVLDARAVLLERDGITLRTDTTFGVIAFDEGDADEERLPRALADRLAFEVDLRSLRAADCPQPPFTGPEIEAARARVASVRAGEASLAALCAAAAALGIGSLRAPLQALRVARAAAALAGREEVAEEDASLAAGLVFAHRATRLPAPPRPEETPEEESSEEESRGEEPREAELRDEARRADDARADAEPEPPPDRESAGTETTRGLEERVVAAAVAAIPADLLARLTLTGERRAGRGAGGRAGAWRSSPRRGRPAGVRRGDPRHAARLNVVETLRAAAPWQTLRRRAAAAAVDAAASGAVPRGARPRARIEVHRDDFRITRYRERTQTTTIFTVDASGSSALHRLGEAKGAVELLLADCYVRRDQVALIAFRGRSAELLLPPTRSLVRARRSLAALPGGGGTPLASGLDAARALADATRRRGEVALIVVLTDGRGNIGRDGRPGREAAEADAQAAARALRAAGHVALLVDTSPQPQPRAARLAAAMNARYLALPYADAARLSGAIRAATPAQP